MHGPALLKMTDLPTEDDVPPPEGFQRMALPVGPFFALLGPIYHRRADDGSTIFALRLKRIHTNILGIPHGGMLVTFADGALGLNLALRRPGQPMVTVNLTTDFLAAAHIGDWLEAQVTIHKEGSRLSFADCVLRVGERKILRASGVFAVIEGAAPRDRFDG